MKEPELGDVRMHGVVPKFSATPGEVTHLGVPLGQDNREIYCDRLGLSEPELKGLKDQGVV